MGATYRNYHEGAIIFKEGQKSDVAYVLLSGSVRVYKEVFGKRIEIGTVAAGQFFGEMALISGERRMASAEAAEYCKAVVLTKEIFDGYFQESPAAVRALAKSMIKRLKDIRQECLAQDANKSPFMGVCSLLSGLYTKSLTKKHGSLAPQSDQFKLYIQYRAAYDAIKDVIFISHMELDEILLRLEELGLVEIAPENMGPRNALLERHILITNPKTFLEDAKAAYEQIEIGAAAELPLMDFLTLEEASGVSGKSTQEVLDLIGSKILPTHALSFTREYAFELERELKPAPQEKATPQKAEEEDSNDGGKQPEAPTEWI